jgi:hypothetical protein
LCAPGCSGETLYPVSGKVLHKGQPLKKAQITLHPKGNTDPNILRPNGETGEDGTFTLTTGRSSGAKAGEYVVTIVCMEEIPNQKKTISTGGPETQDRLRGAYAVEGPNSPTVQIKSGTNQLEPIDLK